MRISREQWRGQGIARRCSHWARAFTLIEVMIAMAVFFIVVFAVLNVVVVSLGAARKLQQRHPNAGMLAAELSLTNCLEEDFQSGDFGEIFPEQTWERQVTQASSNGLWLVQFAIFNKGKGEPVEFMSVLYAKPSCGGMGVRR